MSIYRIALVTIAAATACNAVTGVASLDTDSPASITPDGAAEPPVDPGTEPPVAPTQPDEDAASIDAPSDANGNPDAPPTSALSVTTSAVATSTNLTTEGMLDWIYFGHAGVAAPNHKASGGSLISNLTATNAVISELNDAPTWPANASWTDGTPTASVAGTNWYREYIDSSKLVVSLTAPAAPTTRTLIVQSGIFAASVRIDVALSDNSAAPFTTTINSASVVSPTDTRTTIAYRATAGVTVSMKWTVQTLVTPAGGLLVASATLH
jgi:hypothetical protein